MNYTKLIFVIASFFTMLNANHAQRRIMLSHGFGGDSSTWGVYQPALAQMLTTLDTQDVRIVNYNSRQGVRAASTEVASAVPNNNQNIAVVHSMGGLVWRWLDDSIPGQKAGGIITLGTPNRGGAMLNAMRAGRVQAEVSDGCNRFQGAILVLGTVSRMLGVGAVPATGTGSPTDGLRSFFCSDIMQLVNANLPTATAPQSAIDMSEGSAVVNRLSILNSNTPTFKIGLFGNEDSPVQFRLFSSFVNGPSSRPLDVTDTDGSLVSLFNGVQTALVVSEVIFLVMAEICFYQAFATWNFAVLLVGAAFIWGAYEASDLIRWLSRSESRWNALIGAGGFFTELVNMRVFTCRETMDMIYSMWENRNITVSQMRAIRGNLLADPNCYRVMPVDVLFPINNQSDGLFNVGAARIPEDPNDARHVINLSVDGANHQELLNHRNMTTRFQDIFAGRTQANPFFTTQ